MSTGSDDFAAGEVEKAVSVEQSLFNKPKLRMCRRGGQINIFLWAPLYQLDLLDLKLEEK